MNLLTLGVLGAVLVAGSAKTRAAAEDIYGSAGIRPEAVRQGRLGSCYFHAVVAALAQTSPQMLQGMIKSNTDGTYTVQFADGKKENAYSEDLHYTRDSGYDLSDGLWVAVLFRAYAQKILREELVKAIDQSDLFSMIKSYAKDYISSNDPLLLAYDRAIRTQVDQYGNIDQKKLTGKLKEELGPVPVSDDIKDRFVQLLGSGGFFDSVAEMIKKNGEIFGAYRAVGQGGIAEAVMATFAGEVLEATNDSEKKVGAAMAEAVELHMPMVACTGGSHFYNDVAAGKPLPGEVEPWYVNAHCYTVLGYDSEAHNVTVRNPWKTHPDPNGIFSIPLALFVPAFRGVISTKPRP